MFRISDSVKKWLGHDRKERRGVAILLGLIAIVITLRFSLPESRVELRETYGPDAEQSTGAANFDDASMPALKQTQNRVFRKKSLSEQKGSTRTKRALIELNSCDSAALVSLPGIGPVLSARIIRFRSLLGGFVSADQLKEVYGLPAETFEMIKDKVTADTNLIKRIKINSAVYRDLSRLPYFEKYEVSSILKYRELNKHISGIEELIDNKILTPEKASRTRQYLDFE